MSKRKSLGQNLQTVLEIAKNGISEEQGHLKNLNLQLIDIHHIVPGRGQPRRHFDQGSLNDLAASIKAQGLLQPILVRAINDTYEIVAGERRWRASQLAGLTQLSCIICDIDDKTAIIFGLLENIQRKELNPIEEAQGLKRLIDEFFLTHEQIGQSLGIPRTSITNSLRLLLLSEKVKINVQNKYIDVGHAKLLMPFEHNLQEQILAMIIEKKLSVRETEQEIKKIRRSQTTIEKKQENDHAHIEKIMEEGVKKIREYLALHVDYKIDHKGRGRLFFHFNSPEEAQELVRKLDLVADL